MTQKFHKGDHVRVADDLGPSMSHFESGCEAIVIGSYADQYGGQNHRSYTLHLKGQGEVSWYEEPQLTLLEADRLDLLAQWEAEEEAERRQKADIDWIFEHGPEVLRSAHGASISTLARGVGITDLWGSNGEGISYYENAMRVLGLAAPFLETKDKAGWFALCEKVKLRTADYKITGVC